jgi:hypothetical protein
MYVEWIIKTIFFTGVAVAIILLIRELVCWYWKINEGIVLLTEIRDLLKQERTEPQPLESGKISRKELI